MKMVDDIGCADVPPFSRNIQRIAVVTFQFSKSRAVLYETMLRRTLIFPTNSRIARAVVHWLALSQELMMALYLKATRGYHEVESPVPSSSQLETGGFFGLR
jgi:hypothetical protein